MLRASPGIVGIMTSTPSTQHLDFILSAQLIVAWAGETSDEDAPRLGWWRSDCTSEFGGVDLFERLLPQTGAWAVLEAARAVAIARDAALRAESHSADQLHTVFHLGFELDERVADRLAQLKRSGRTPADALPMLGEVCVDPLDRDAFAAWLSGHDGPGYAVTPVGRRLKGKPSADPQVQVAALLSILAPLADAWPVPYFEQSAN